MPLGSHAAQTGVSSRLALLLDQTVQGSGGSMVVERGVHAPMFCDAAAGEAGRRRIAVRRAAGSPHPFGPFEVVCELLGLDVETPEADEVRRTGTGLTALRALTERIHAQGERGPQVLLIDRAEHVDVSSARFLGYLAQQLEGHPTSLVLVAGEVTPRSWLDDLASASAVGLLRLRASEGGGAGHPAHTQLARLDRPHQNVVEALAVLGPGGSLAAAATVSAEPIDVVLEALEQLTSLGVLDHTATGAGHLLVADDVLHAMGPTRRSELHLRAAAHARSIGESAIRLSTHLEHVVPGALPWAATHLRAGAALALQADDPRAAVRWMRRAIEEDDSCGVEVPVAVLLELARAQARAGDTGAAATLRLAIERSSAQDRPGVLIRLARQLSLTGRLREAAAVFDEVLADIDPCDAAQRDLAIEARVGLATAVRCSLELRSRSAELLRQLTDDVAAADLDDPNVLAEVAYEHALAGTSREVVLDLAGRATAAMGRRSLSSGSSQALFLAIVWAEDLESASALCDLLHADAQADPVGAHRRATIALADGDHERAVAHGRVAVEDMEWAAPMLVPGARAQLARSLVRCGDLDRAEAALRLPGGEGRWRQQAAYHPVLLAKAELAAAREEWRLASSFADRCAEFSRAMGTHNPVVVPWHEVSARALAALGQVEGARSLLADAIERAAGFGAPRALAQLEATDRSIRGFAPASPATRRRLPLPPPNVPPPDGGGPVLRLLGDAVLVVDDVERRLGDDLADRAVCIVALARGSVHDEQLAEALWPDGDPAVGRNRLRNVLLRVRQRHGPVIERRGRSIALSDDVAVDVHEFDRLVIEFLHSTDAVHAERIGRRALELHVGELCPGHPFEPWASTAREAVRAQWLLLADRMAELVWQRGDVAGSLAITEQAVAADPWDEDRYLDAVERLVSADRPAAARSLLRRCERACAELAVTPSTRHRSLAASLR